jgi:hypothetical protein
MEFTEIAWCVIVVYAFRFYGNDKDTTSLCVDRGLLHTFITPSGLFPQLQTLSDGGNGCVKNLVRNFLHWEFFEHGYTHVVYAPWLANILPPQLSYTSGNQSQGLRTVRCQLQPCGNSRHIAVGAVCLLFPDLYYFYYYPSNPHALCVFVCSE